MGSLSLGRESKTFTAAGGDDKREAEDERAWMADSHEES